MFTKNTVFVVGAGAGVDYNMPLGKELKESISSLLDAREDPLWKALTLPLNLTRQEDATAYRELKAFIASNMDRAESIDNFLHTHSENTKLVTVGKTAITSCILSAERNSGLMPRVRDRDDISMLFRQKKESWLTRFCTMALTGVLLKDAARAFDNVTIVTFNYDRCIELYLVDHIRDYLGISEKDAQIIVDSIEIIHVYGKIGRLPWQRGDTTEVPFGYQPLPTQLLPISKEIRTFTERLDEDDTQERVEAALAMAELVVFSGFSFGSSNWEFLQNNTPGPDKVAIVGVYGISQPNQENIGRRLRDSLHPSSKVEIHTCDKGFLDLLYDYSTFFE